MADSNEDLGRSRRPGVEDRGWSSTGQVLGGRTIGRSGDIVVKQIGLGFPSFASELAEERRWVVHGASSRRSYGSEAKDGWFDGVGCSAVQVRPNYHLLDVIFILA
jgi:hypothetical protein